MKWISLFFYLFNLSNSWAHPIANEEGAFSFMTVNTPQMSDNMMLYSPKFWLGTGINHVEMNNDKWTNIHLGYLVKRWNEFASQANLYLIGGPGILKSSDQTNYFTRYGLQADWETRQIYTLAKYNTTRSKLKDFEEYQVRFGFAPYLAGYEELNTWLILQLQHIPQFEQETIITPVLRMFYRNVLWEIGSSLNSQWMFSFMVRY